jgi:hypothetical protein
MRPNRQQTLFILGALVGLGGCVSGSLDDGSVQEPSAGSAGQQSGVAGNGTGSGNTSGTATGTAGTSNASGGSSAQGGSATQPVAGTSNGSGGTSNVAGSTAQGGADGSGGTSVTPHDCKRGVAWASNKLDNAEVNSQLTWWYKWGLTAQTVGAGLEFVPMISGGGTNVTDDNKAIRPDAKYLLGYNEPNFMSQANMTAQQAAADWPTLEAVAKAHDLKLVSPAVNYCGDDKTGTGPCNGTNPATYLKDFFAACANCQVDYVAVHWYNCDGASLKSYLDMFKQFKRPLWLTEFACAYGGDTSVAGQEKYMREAIPILEGRSDVFRYAWFSGDPIPEARLLNADGSPNALGKVYLSLPRDPTCTP